MRASSVATRVDIAMPEAAERQRNPKRTIVTTAVAVAIAVLFVSTLGLPIDHLEIVGASAVIALVLGWRLPGRGPLRLVVDWLPVALALFAYGMVRGAADQMGIGTNFGLAPRLDHDLTGVIPTVWLQAHMYAGNYHHWWNVVLTGIYDSHFVAPPLLLAWLWSRKLDWFYDFRRRLVGLTYLSLFIFIVHPAAPPWMASQRHVIGPIARTSRLGTATLHLQAAPALIDSGAKAVDQVAAFPSLHAGLAVLPLIYFWRKAPAWLRVVLVAYPLSMGFTLVATGEHWLSDVLAAWLLAWVVHRASSAYEHRAESSPVRARPEPERSNPVPAMARVATTEEI